MTPPPPRTAAVFSVIIITLLFSVVPPKANGLGGSASAVAVSYGSAITVCGIIAQQPRKNIQCWRNGQIVSPMAGVSFDSVAGGLNIVCGIRSGGHSLICWDTISFTAKRLFFNPSTVLTSFTIGDTQICALTNGNKNLNCWRGDVYTFDPANGSSNFSSISSGIGFSCGILQGSKSNRVVCWGSKSTNSLIASNIQSGFNDSLMLNVFVGGRHACGFNTSGFVICRGINNNGQLNVPSNLGFEYKSLALGSNHTCGIRRLNNTVVCWGGNGEYSSNFLNEVSFESIFAGFDFTCGLRSSNFSIVCWGPGWPNNSSSSVIGLPLPPILPGQCVNSNCSCGIYPQSQTLCSGNGNICKLCDLDVISPPVSPPPVFASPATQTRSSRGLKRGLLAFAIVGSIGAFAGICSIIFCLWTGVCFGKKKIHNSVQPTINEPPRSNSNPFSRSFTLRQYGSRVMTRQRSGPSTNHPDRAEEYQFKDLALATNNFSLDNKIGAGSFGVVYKGKLLNGRDVAIKRGETSPKTKKFQEKESAFESELLFLSRLHHKHLVRLVGYCDELEERLLVYEFMKNGSLYSHLHNKNNVDKNSSFINSWKMRVKISLDAARGIDYLHNYAVPPIIHRDIKSSNILLDENWTARVSDFGLSLMTPESNQEFKPTKAAGTVGYIDPEYYSFNVLTTKSDVYGLGVVLLELLTGKTAIFLRVSEDGGDEPISVVEYATPAIMVGELTKILDKRVGSPELHEAEAVELVAYTALHCVNLEGKDRPTMKDIVANLERAISLFGDSHGSISSEPLSFASN